jgi:HD-GYP domain-containing protein (c-di-GMP phosphodiesterase class II)
MGELVVFLLCVGCIGPFAVDALKEQVDQVMVQVKKSAKLKSLFKQAKVDRNADNYVSTHIGMIVNISAAICIKMEWSSDKTLEKLEVLKEKISEDDYKLVFDHSNIAAKVIENFNEIPPDVEMIIRQHHELPNQTGFPNAIGYQKITPFSAVFIVAHCLTDYIIENPKWAMDEFVKKYRSRLHGSHFTKIMRLLPEIK